MEVRAKVVAKTTARNLKFMIEVEKVRGEVEVERGWKCGDCLG